MQIISTDAGRRVKNNQLFFSQKKSRVIEHITRLSKRGLSKRRLQVKARTKVGALTLEQTVLLAVHRR